MEIIQNKCFLLEDFFRFIDPFLEKMVISFLLEKIQKLNSLI
jgi:hypothetical protein